MIPTEEKLLEALNEQARTQRELVEHFYERGDSRQELIRKTEYLLIRCRRRGMIDVVGGRRGLWSITMRDEEALPDDEHPG